MNDNKLIAIICPVIAALLIVSVILGVKRCNDADELKQDFMKSCVSAGRSPLECRESARW